MADSQTKRTAGTQREDVPAPRAGSKPLSWLVIIGFVIAAIVVQLAIAWALVSTLAKAAQSHTTSQEQQLDQALDEDLLLSGASDASTVEVELGEFTVTAYRPSSEMALRIDFRLFGTVKEGNEDEFQRRFRRHQNRVREQVLVIMRNAELTDLTDPGLGLIKRRILTKVNRTLGMPPLLQTIVISDFSFLEQ